MSETTCEVLRPTLEEFKDFRKFVEKVVDDKIGGIAGIIKIIPPDGWFTGKYDNIDQIKFRPVQQQVVNKESGAYTLGLQDVEEMSVETFKNYAVLNQASTDDHAQLERQFWRNLGKQTSYADGEMMYGADVQGTLFDGAHACGWNLSNLDSALRLIGCDIPGVSSSMLYIGMWSTMFPMHVEDCDLYSINYLHVGERKSWYCVRILFYIPSFSCFVECLSLFFFLSLSLSLCLSLFLSLDLLLPACIL
jgi:[histone H3]-trimethyl-L-lysine9/36 demethylase